MSQISTNAARFLVAFGVWSWVIWLMFARNIAKDDTRATAFYVVHAILIVVSLVLGTIVGVIGWRALRR